MRASGVGEGLDGYNFRAGHLTRRSWRRTFPAAATRTRTLPTVTDPSLRERADRRFERALQETGARDPRDFYREQLRTLRERDERAFRKALHHFEHELTPRVADEDSDPVAEWLEYGRLLATLMADGRTIQIDATGRSLDYAPPVPLDHLVLHLPTATRERALIVGLPPTLSPAQRATYDLLVAGAQG